jgi:hypothetical protein
MRKTVIATRLFIAIASPAAAQPATPQQRANVEAACKADVAKLCKGVQPGGGRLAVCLKQNEQRVSAECRAAVASVRAGR